MVTGVRLRFSTTLAVSQPIESSHAAKPQTVHIEFQMSGNYWSPYSSEDRIMSPRISVINGIALCCLMTFCAAAAFAQDAATAETRRVYVPFDQLDVILDRDGKGVMLPRKEFETLYQKAQAARKSRLRLPRGIVLSNIEYDARIAGDQLLVTATVEFTQFTPGWQILSLPLKGLAVERATLNGQPARLGRLPQNGRTLQLLSDQTGAQKLTLELSTPLSAVGSDKVATLGLILATAATLQVALPAGKHLLVDGLSLKRPAAIDQQASYRVPIGGKANVVLRITDRRTDRAADSFVLASTRYAVSVAPGSVSWRAETTLNVFGQTIDRLICNVPKTLEITAVESSGLESWELADSVDDQTKTIITLNYRQPFDGTRQIVLTGVMTTPAGAVWTIPNLHIEGVASHVGRVAVVHPRGTRLRLNRETGVRRVTGSAAANPIRKVSAKPTAAVAVNTLLFDVWQDEFTLDFVTQTKEREIIADIFTQLDISDSGLTLNVLNQIETVYAPLFELDVALPEAWSVTAVSSEGKPLEWRVISKADGSQTVRVSFAAPLSPGNTLKFLLEARLDPAGWPVGTAGVEVDLPEVRLPQAAVVEGTFLIAATADFDVEPRDVRGLDPEHLPGSTGQLGYRYQDTRFSGRLQIAQRPSRISAETLTFTRLDPRALRSHLSAEIEVQGGGLRSLKVVLPAAASTDLRFRMLPTRDEQGNSVPPRANIIEQQPAAPANGGRVWTLKFDRRLKGRFALAVDVETVRGEGSGEQKPGFFEPHVLQISGAERQNGIIAIEASAEQLLKIDAKGNDGRPLVEVDPADLPLPPDYRPRERIVAVYRYAVDGFTVTFAEERFDRVPVPTAICRSANMTSILGETGDFQHQTRFQITAVGVQSVGVRLPKGAVLWSTMIDSRPIEVRRDGDLYLIPLPPGQGATAVQILDLFYKTQHDPLTLRGRIRQQPPQLSAMVGGTEQPLEILQQSWEVRYPRGTLLTQSGGQFQPERELDRSSLLSQIQQEFAIGSMEGMGRNLLAVAIAAAIIAVLTLGYRKKGFVGLGASSAVLLVIGVAFLIPSVVSRNRLAIDFTGGSAQSLPNAMYAEPVEMSTPPFGTVTGGDMDDAEMPPMEEGLVQERRLFERGPATENDEGERYAKPPTLDPAKVPARPPLVMNEDGRRKSSPASDSGIKGKSAPGSWDRKKFSNTRQPGSGRGDGGFFDLPNPRALTSQENLPAGGTIVGLAAPGQFTQELGVTFRSTSIPAASVRGALLSVAVALPQPAGHRSVTFKYLGNGGGADAAAIDVSYENSRGGGVFRLFLATAILCVFWFARRRPTRTKAILGALGVTLPLALIAVTPVTWHLVLDGLFFGSLAGVMLWLITNRVQAWSGCCRGLFAARTTAGLVLLAASFTSVDSVSAQNQPAGKNQPGDQTIVIPYSPDGDPLSGGRVFLPQAKFLELWNDAYPEKREKTPAPIEGLVAGAIYSAELAPERNGTTGRIAVTARFVLHSFRDHQITLPLPLGPVATRSATLDGKPAALLVTAGPAANVQANAAPNQAAASSLSVVVTGAGLHLLDVEFDLPAQLTGPAGAFTAPLLPVATGKFTFTPPANDLSIRVNGVSSAFRIRKAGDDSFVEVPVDAGGGLRLSWQPVKQRGGIDVIVHSEAATAALFDDAGLTITTSHLLRVRQGSLKEAIFTLPTALKLKTISGPDVGGWGIAEVDNQRILRVFLRRAIDDETRITCELFQPLSIAGDVLSFPLPAFAPRDVIREIGTVGIVAPPQFLVRGAAGRGINQINASQFAPPGGLKLPSSPQLAYRYTARPFELNLSVSRRSPQTRAVAEHTVYVGRRKVSVTSTIDLNLQQTPRSRLAVRLPAGYVPLQVDAPGISDWYVNKDDNGVSELIIELNAPRTGAVTLSLGGTIRKEPDDAQTLLSLPYPLGVNRLESGAAVRIDEFYVPTLGELGDWKSVRPDRLSPRLRSVQTGSVRFAFVMSQTAPGVIAVNLQRAEVELDASSVTTVTVGDADIGYRLELQWAVKRAATDRFAFTAPDWLAGKLQVRAPGLRRVIETDLVGPRTRWDVLLQDPVRGRYYLMADAILSPPADDKLQTPVPIFVGQRGGEVNFSPLETQQHFVVVVNLSRNQVSASNRDNLEDVVADDLPIKLVDSKLIEQASELVRLSRAEPAPVWKVTKFQHERGAAAVVNLATLLTVVERDGSYRTQVVYSVRNRTRQYLAVQLPEGVKLLSVFVKGQASRTVKAKRDTKSYHLVPLANTSQADPSFDVKLVYSGRLQSGSLPRGVRLAQSIDLPAPRIPSVKDSAEFGVPVGRTTWTVYLPKEYHTAPETDLKRNNFTLSTPERVGLIRAMISRLDFISVSNVALTSRSERTRFQAANNLKQLGLALHNYQDVSDDNDEVQQFNKLQEQALEQERFNRSNYRIDEANETTIIVDGSSSMQLDVRGQKAEFKRQSDNQFLSNSAGIIISSENDFSITKDSGGKKDEGRPGDGKSGEGKPGNGEKYSGLESRFRQRAQQSFGDQQKELNRQQDLNFSVQRTHRTPILKLQTAQPANEPDMSAPPTPAEQDLLDEIEITRRIRRSDDADLFEGQRDLQFWGADASTPDDTVSSGEWTQAGGLSLEIEVPVDGQAISFSKVSGNPRLALSVRPRESVETGLGLVWALVWLAVGIGLAGLLSRARAASAIFHSLPKAMVGVGLVAFFLFVNPAVAWLGFVVFLIGAMLLGYQYRRPAV
jgi:hypothetical protein